MLFVFLTWYWHLYNNVFPRVSPFLVKVTLGAYDRCIGDLTSINVSVSNIIPLPFFDPRTGNHDLALLKLTNPVTFSDYIRPVCLPDASKWIRQHFRSTKVDEIFININPKYDKFYVIFQIESSRKCNTKRRVKMFLLIQILGISTLFVRYFIFYESSILYSYICF